MKRQVAQSGISIPVVPPCVTIIRISSFFHNYNRGSQTEQKSVCGLLRSNRNAIKILFPLFRWELFFMSGVMPMIVVTR
jgi:hypothetical protein